MREETWEKNERQTEIRGRKKREMGREREKGRRSERGREGERKRGV